MTFKDWLNYVEFCSQTGLPIEMTEDEQLKTLEAINKLKYEEIS